jgi:protein-S-isoprenylcysteine O-methyltransferase Ste14
MEKDLGPAVKFPPPALFVGGLGVGVLLDRFGRVPSLIPDSMVLQAIGVVLAVAGLTLVYTGILTFRKFRTAIYPNRPAKLVVDGGVYAYTRNPMYVGMTVFYIGGVLVLHSLGAFALLPVVLVVLYTQVIVREERHLREKFPAEYTAYCNRVRRWL